MSGAIYLCTIIIYEEKNVNNLLHIKKFTKNITISKGFISRLCLQDINL